MRGVGEGGFSGMMPCLRRMSFLRGFVSRGWVGVCHAGCQVVPGVTDHSVSALGSSMGTAIRWSVGAAILVVGFEGSRRWTACDWERVVA